VAVVAASDFEGNIFAIHIEPKYISAQDFKVFMRKLRDHERGRHTKVLLDNLNIHRRKDVLKLASRYNQEFIFNASYSSEFNPIEIAWSWTKQKFAREMIH